jgi:hypothetical protein
LIFKVKKKINFNTSHPPGPRQKVRLFICFIKDSVLHTIHFKLNHRLHHILPILLPPTLPTLPPMNPYAFIFALLKFI